MSLSKTYLNQLKEQVQKWDLAAKVTILREKYLSEVDAGFIRIRAELNNGDVLELSEYAVAEEGQVRLKSYTFHWQDAQGRLKKRWDNAPYHKRVTTHPYHLHEGTESNIVESEPMHTERVLAAIEGELTSKA